MPNVIHAKTLISTVTEYNTNITVWCRSILPLELEHLVVFNCGIEMDLIGIIVSDAPQELGFSVKASTINITELQGEQGG